MKKTDFSKILGGLDQLTKAQARRLFNELKGQHYDNISGHWWDNDSPTTEIKAAVSF